MLKKTCVMMALAGGLVMGGIGMEGNRAMGALAKIDERPAVAGEWGFKPTDGGEVGQTPAFFVWRPQKDAAKYELVVAKDKGFKDVVYRKIVNEYCGHTPIREFDAGEYFWRFRFYKKGAYRASAWSKKRSFKVKEGAAPFVLPDKGDLLARLPEGHPRLFVRPEERDEVRSKLLDKGYKGRFTLLLKKCDDLIAKKIEVKVPPKYPASVKTGSKEWKDIWWGNKRHTIEVLNGAEALAFANWVKANKAYRDEAKRLLLEAAKWDPEGATSIAYNDEAGMSFCYYFSRAYTFLYHELSDAERKQCADLMKIRGGQMYHRLHDCYGHMWKPYDSHNNRMWHFLGEVGVAFNGEFEEAGEWAWYAMNVFANSYPVWVDEDGGWHEGMAYYRSYLSLFTWWYDVMRSGFKIDGFDRPALGNLGWFPIYILPPGDNSGGFGDLARHMRTAKYFMDLEGFFASVSGNGYWQDYVNRAEVAEDGYKKKPYLGDIVIETMREVRYKPVEAKTLAELPKNKLFKGIGVVSLNNDLTNGLENLQVLFKSSPFGTQSHGYDAQNSIVLSLGGKQLILKSGRRDCYGSAHHKNWMWHTRGSNNILVNGKSQSMHTRDNVGEIIKYEEDGKVVMAVGRIENEYGGDVKRFDRKIVRLGEQAVIVVDVLNAKKEAEYEWRLHAVKPFEISDGGVVEGNPRIMIKNEGSECSINTLWPVGVNATQTNEFPYKPFGYVPRESHLSIKPIEKAKRQVFVTLIDEFAIEGKWKSEAVKDVKSEAGLVSVTAEVEGLDVVVEVDNQTGKVKVSRAGKLIGKMSD